MGALFLYDARLPRYILHVAINRKLGVTDTVEYVSREYYDGCMLDRNHRLVEAAGLLLAVYNGERRGGTAATVRYARKLERTLVILNPTSLEAVRE